MGPASQPNSGQGYVVRMAETVSFPSNGSEASGYLVRPAGGSGPGVLVIQEWWGLDSGIKEMATRLAADGFVALAPDLYHGELAAHDEMDKAGQLMNSMPPDRAARDMSGAIDYLSALDGVTGSGIGVVGFCMAECCRSSSPRRGPTRSSPSCRFTGFRSPRWNRTGLP